MLTFWLLTILAFFAIISIMTSLIVNDMEHVHKKRHSKKARKHSH